MALEVGSRLGHYDVTALIGEGGMGQVYQARDTTLDRDVALKVLPQAFTDDPDRLARFEREAKVLASLNHPNIGHIYGLEEARPSDPSTDSRRTDGTHPVRALVLELVEGPTLADRIAQGAIPLDEALPIARQIAEALEAAHEQGVIHRDLKPANIKVKDDGTVKVLDFGLAKALDPVVQDFSSEDPSQSPTLTAAATQMGVIMGTAAYMSPEQARGKTVDKRADIWAFGIVLFEMLTGRRAFEGEDVSLTLADVMRAEPKWEHLPEGLSSALHTYLKRCLQKDPRQRVRDIGDVRLAIEGAFELSESRPTGAADAPVGDQLTRRQRALPWVAGIAVGVLIAGLAAWTFTPQSLRPLGRFVVSTEPTVPLVVSRNGGDVAISPDGTRIVYVAGSLDSSHLHVRPVDQLEGTRISSEERVETPFVSPDSAWVGFYSPSDDAWKKVSISGGPSVTLFESAARSRGASWGPNDTIVFAQAGNTGLFRISADGGEPVALTTPDAERGETRHYWPEFLPGGEAVLFEARSSRGSEVTVFDLTTTEQTVLLLGRAPHYTATGHLIYGVEDTLWAVPFDLDRREITGNPTRVLDGVMTKENDGTRTANFGLSMDGSLVYVAGGSRTAIRRTLVWVDRQGREEAIVAAPLAYSSPRLSPNGNRVALVVDDEGLDIWMWDFTRELLSPFTTDAAFDGLPLWTPAGDRLVFTSRRTGGVNSMFWKAADGSGTIERLVESPNIQNTLTITPDGMHLVFGESADFHLLSLDDGRTSEPLLVTEVDIRNPHLSPNGQWMAYDSNPAGQFEVYVRSFPAVDEGPLQISNSGGSAPFWGPDGLELFYVTSESLMRVPMESGPAMTPGRPEALFALAPYLTNPVGAGRRQVDIAPNGQRFLMIKKDSAADTSASPQLVLVQNWSQELLERVPVP